MTYRTTPVPTQTPLPIPADPEEGAPESIKLEHTAKGPRWSIRVHIDPTDEDKEAVERLYQLDALMRRKFGEPA
jgi:hypothetical protein